jgi:RHS repeat-associated protein
VKSERLSRTAAEPGITGKEEDAEVGLTCFGKRYLNSYLGRWISADPLAIHAPGEADPNVYAYVRGRTLKNVGPLGPEEDQATNALFEPNESLEGGGVSDGTREQRQRSWMSLMWR